MSDLNLKVSTNLDGDTVIRQGHAANVYDPVKVEILGQITAPRLFFKSRKDSFSGDEKYFEVDQTHVLVDREAGSIVLKCNESDKFGDVVMGRLEFSKEYLLLGINEGKVWTPADLANILKKTRYIFPSVEEAMSLITDLKNFKATVTGDTEITKDERGNRKNSLDVAVKTNVPLFFNISIPLFKGFAPSKIRVEIELDSQGHRVDCYLTSFDAITEIDLARKTIFDTELAPFLEEGITVIEI
jgi:hypothetical protein